MRCAVKRRKLLWLAGLGLLVAAAIPLAPYAYYGVRGFLNHEPFFKGMPAGYWRGKITTTSQARKRLSDTLANVSATAARWVAERPSPLANDDPAAVPVLLYMTRDADPEVRAEVICLLRGKEKYDDEVLKTYRTGMDDEDKRVRHESSVALVRYLLRRLGSEP